MQASCEPHSQSRSPWWARIRMMRKAIAAKLTSLSWWGVSRLWLFIQWRQTQPKTVEVVGLSRRLARWLWSRKLASVSQTFTTMSKRGRTRWSKMRSGKKTELCPTLSDGKKHSLRLLQLRRIREMSIKKLRARLYRWFLRCRNNKMLEKMEKAWR